MLSGYIMHLDVLSDEGVLFRRFKYRRVEAAIDDLSQPVKYLNYYPPPVDRLAVFPRVRPQGDPEKDQDRCEQRPEG
jgi:hypothetical protein